MRKKRHLPKLRNQYLTTSNPYQAKIPYLIILPKTDDLCVTGTAKPAYFMRKLRGKNSFPSKIPLA